MKTGGDEPRDKLPVVASWMRQYTAVIEFLGMLAVLGYIGHRIDHLYGSDPWGIMSGLLAALAAGVYRMIREGQRLDQ